MKLYMQICMKNQQKKLAHLKAELPKAVRKAGKSYAEIGRIAGVHGSHVSRICNGEFETLSQNVVQVCKVLGLPVAEVALSGDEALERQLQAAVLNVWDGSQDGAKRITRLLRNVSELQAASPPSNRRTKSETSAGRKKVR